MQQNEIVQAMKDGAILAVNWEEIDEMLGLQPEHILQCALYENSGNFLPNLRCEFAVTENEVLDILKEAGINWVSEDYPADKIFIGRITTRFFSVKEPNRVRWMNNPNKKR